VFSLVEQQIFYVKWLTSMGLIRAELRGDIVPITVQNFMNLCYKDFYTNLIFHRVIVNFMIQDGCPIGNGTGDPGYEFADEFDDRLRHSFPGVLSMANAGADTNGSQYFITVIPTAWLDDAHSVFGRIIDGMNVVYDISKVPVDADSKPLTDVNIYSISVDEKEPVLNLTFPLEGETFIENAQIPITWESAYNEGIKIEFSSNGDDNWETVVDSINDDQQSYLWTVPCSISTNCKLRLTSINYPELLTQSTAPFVIRVKPAKLDRIECYDNVVASPENPENYFMPGKIFRFKVKVLNDYTEDFNQLTATLSTTSSFVTINQDVVNFQTVKSGETAWSEQEFEIFISATLPSNCEYEFEINFADANFIDEPWITKFTIPILIKNNFVLIDDDATPDSQGNDNNKIEPLETVELKVNLQNKSKQILYDTFGKLEAESDLINVWNDVQGVDGIVYDTVSYNNYLPIQANMNSILANNDFVFYYSTGEKYKLNFNLLINTYLQTTKDLGGTNIKYLIPVSLNAVETYIENTASDSEINFALFPNPTNDFFTIKIENQSNILIEKVEIINAFGKIVYENKIKNQHSEIFIEYKLKSGVYIIKITDSEHKIKTKILIKE